MTEVKAALLGRVARLVGWGECPASWVQMAEDDEYHMCGLVEHPGVLQLLLHSWYALGYGGRGSVVAGSAEVVWEEIKLGRLSIAGGVLESLLMYVVQMVPREEWPERVQVELIECYAGLLGV